MGMKRLFIPIIFFSVFCLNAQVRHDTLRLYFRINEVTSAENFSRLDSFIQNYQSQNPDIHIIGRADYLNTNVYNLRLSEKRANQAKKHLQEKFPGIIIKSCTGIGEKYSNENKSPLGEPMQRRVDVIVQTKKTGSDSVPPRKNIARVPPVTHAPLKKIEDLKKGESMALEGLSFIPGRHFILRSSAPILERLLKTMQDHPDLKIEIQGHVCCTDGGDDGFDFDSENRKLSENRAKFVYDYLIQNGIDAGRLSYKGFGHTRPKIKHERTPEEEQMNRRVEILVIDN